MLLSHDEFRKAYFFLPLIKKMDLITNICYQDLNLKHEVLLFCDWFTEWYPNQNYVHVLNKETTFKVWTKSDGTTIHSVYHPTGTLLISQNGKRRLRLILLLVVLNRR